MCRNGFKNSGPQTIRILIFFLQFIIHYFPVILSVGNLAVMVAQQKRETHKTRVSMQTRDGNLKKKEFKNKVRKHAFDQEKK